MNLHDLVIEHFGWFVEHLGMSDELYSLICEHLGKNNVVTLVTTIICLGSTTDGGRTVWLTPTIFGFQAPRTVLLEL